MGSGVSVLEQHRAVTGFSGANASGIQNHPAQCGEPFEIDNVLLHASFLVPRRPAVT